MIVSLFRRRTQSVNRRIVDALFEAIVAAARQPVLYAHWGMPDTPLGRYESVGLHMILFLHRTRAEGTELEALARDVVDEFFREVDHSIRELGVGDAGVPKRMKKLLRMFYGRIGPYWEAIDSQDVSALAAAVERNIAPDAGAHESLNAHALAAYMLANAQHLAGQSDTELLSGAIDFVQAKASQDG